MNFLLYVLSTGLLLTALSQDVTTQNVLYHSNKRTDTSTGKITMDLNRLLIKGKTKLEWQDGHSVVRYSFDIKSSTGTLALNRSGEITYQVASERINGRFTVKKVNDVIKISAVLVEDAKPMIVDFEVGSYTIID